jgi:type III secretion protein N (ATPase)
MRDIEIFSRSLTEALNCASTLEVHGRVKQVVGTLITASVKTVRIGEICRLYTPGDPFSMEAEVVGFRDSDVLLSPIGALHGISSSTLVVPSGTSMRVPVGPGLLGRVLDGFGRPLDQRGESIEAALHYPVYADAPPPLSRRLISRPLPLGVRAIDGLLTCAEGQRIGIFAAAGGGKSTLLGMLAKNADVDVTVIALVGERGREVREFIERELGVEHLARCVVVCATSDRSPMERAKASLVATAIAEYFRDQGKRVLFLLDSVTRFARALREIGLAAGEPPTRRGFPPSVFGMLPGLMERAGMNDKGSITAFYTVLVEGDDMNEPVADETRSILDGHIILSRKLGAMNHFPAIDILASTSRVMSAVVTDGHRSAAGSLREMMARYDEVELLVKLGEYKRGTDKVADKAIDRIASIRAFLCQRPDERSDFDETIEQLEGLVA